LALHAILGGLPAGFHVTCIKDRHFHFSMASKRVGFPICELKRVITNHFDVHFHLWRDDGANWFKEWNKWHEEEIDSWQLISKRKRRSSSSKHVSFAPKLIQDSPAKKFSPRETIFAGDFACELNPCLDFSSRRAQDSNLKNSANAIPIKVLFDRPKSQVPQGKQVNSELKSPGYHDEPKVIGWRDDLQLRGYHYFGVGTLC
jgi:hypothetical protein